LPLSTFNGLGAPNQGAVNNVNPVRLDFSVNAERDKGRTPCASYLFTG
jgi:hypothetical protein